MPSIPRPTVLLLDCDNTLTLTEENAFAATTETINTLLADFKIPAASSNITANGNGGARPLTAAALLSLDIGSSVETHIPQDTDTSSELDSDSDEQKPKYQTYSAPALLASYIGLPFRQILTSIASRHDISLSPAELKHYVSLEEVNVNRHITLHSPPAEDILSTLLSLRSNGQFKKIAVVSSSPLARMRTALQKAQLYPDIFTEADLFSACDSLTRKIEPSSSSSSFLQDMSSTTTPTTKTTITSKPQHKPHPAIYLHTLESLQVSAEECLAVEDSVSGTLSAVRAGIRVWCYVGAYHDPAKRDTMGRVLRENGAERVFGKWLDFEGMLLSSFPSACSGEEVME